MTTAVVRASKVLKGTTSTISHHPTPLSVLAKFIWRGRNDWKLSISSASSARQRQPPTPRLPPRSNPYRLPLRQKQLQQQQSKKASGGETSTRPPPQHQQRHRLPFDARDRSRLAAHHVATLCNATLKAK